jgi:hypothetical protein
MMRENRYVVLKRSDIDAAGLTKEEYQAFYLACVKIEAMRELNGKQPLECVVVEKDWPEYQPTWAAIAARVDGVPVEAAGVQQLEDYGE